MSTFFMWAGVVTVGVVCVLAGWVIFEIAGNIYGGIKGAYRIRAIHVRSGGKPFLHWWTIKYGLQSWYGRRFDGDCGNYVRMGGLKVGVDGRDPIVRARYPG